MRHYSWSGLDGLRYQAFSLKFRFLPIRFVSVQLDDERNGDFSTTICPEHAELVESKAVVWLDSAKWRLHRFFKESSAGCMEVRAGM